LPLVVSKKNEEIGSVSEDRGVWRDIISLEIEIPDGMQKWTLQITGCAVVSGMQLGFTVGGQILDWVFGTGAGTGWEQQSAVDIIQEVLPGKHEVTLEGTRGTAMRRRLIAIAWPEDLPTTASGRKSSAKKKSARKSAPKKTSAKSAASGIKKAVKKKPG
jgi:hypothetical protein